MEDYYPIVACIDMLNLQQLQRQLQWPRRVLLLWLRYFLIKTTNKKHKEKETQRIKFRNKQI